MPSDKRLRVPSVKTSGQCRKRAWITHFPSVSGYPVPHTSKKCSPGLKSDILHGKTGRNRAATSRFNAYLSQSGLIILPQIPPHCKPFFKFFSAFFRLSRALGHNAPVTGESDPHRQRRTGPPERFAPAAPGARRLHAGGAPASPEQRRGPHHRPHPAGGER